MARLKLGDVIEIPTSAGLAYGHCTNKHEEFGELLRVFAGLYRRRPADLGKVIGDVQFICFFPLHSAVKRKIVSIIGAHPVPTGVNEFPLFRAAGIPNPGTGELDWWLWDGSREWRVGSLTPDQRSLPIRSIWNEALLMDRIASGWRASEDVV